MHVRSSEHGCLGLDMHQQDRMVVNVVNSPPVASSVQCEQIIRLYGHWSMARTCDLSFLTCGELRVTAKA